MDISGDAGIRAQGQDCKEAFANAASGMYSLVTDPGSVDEKISKQIRVSASSMDSLLVDFLNELIFMLDAHGFVGRRVDILELEADSGFSLSAVIHGEEFDASRHERRLLIKAATYHKLRITQNSSSCVVEIIFDI